MKMHNIEIVNFLLKCSTEGGGPMEPSEQWTRKISNSNAIHADRRSNLNGTNGPSVNVGREDLNFMPLRRQRLTQPVNRKNAMHCRQISRNDVQNSHFRPVKALNDLGIVDRASTAPIERQGIGLLRRGHLLSGPPARRSFAAGGLGALSVVQTQALSFFFASRQPHSSQKVVYALIGQVTMA
jgi:hypothetical protein